MAMNSATITHWLRAMVQAMPHGGKKKAAEMLDISPSGLSKILNDPERSFDEKTLRAVAWVETSKSAKYSEEEYPITATVIAGPIVVETRQGKGGEEFFTWKPVKAR